jgi:PPOX class probable F420-dependent enzyme
MPRTFLRVSRRDGCRNKVAGMARLDISMTDDEVRSFLAVPDTAVLSTMGRTGWPHLAGMWFAPRDDELLMWTYAKSQKAVNLRRDPRGALLVERGDRYTELRGVLVRGQVRMIEDHDGIVRIGTALAERYSVPATGEAAAGPPEAEIERQSAKRVGLALPLRRIVSWDHSKLG